MSVDRYDDYVVQFKSHNGKNHTINTINYHGGESRDLNDRVHGISCRYSDKTSKQNLSHFP